MAESALITKKLREEPEHVEGFVSLMIDVYLDRPLVQTVSPTAILPAIVEACRATVDHPGVKDWLVSRVEASRMRHHDGNMTPRETMPPNFPVALKSILLQSKPPDRALVKAVLHNDGMRDLMRAILENTLSEFATKIWDSLPGGNRRSSGGGGLGSRLMGVAKGVVSAVGDGLERQLEDKVDTFVDGALDKVMEMIVDRVSTPPKGTPPWQPMVLDALLDQPFKRFYAEMDKIPAPTSAQRIHSLLSTWAHWDGLEGELHKLYEHRQEQLGQQSLREFLAGSGIEESWRALVQGQMVSFAREVVETDRFSTWLDQLLAT